MAGRSGGGLAEWTEGANAALVTTTLVPRRVPRGTQPILLLRWGAEAGGQEVVPGLIKAPLRPAPGFSLSRGPEAPWRPMAGEEMCESRPRKAKPGGGAWAGTVQREPESFPLVPPRT